MDKILEALKKLLPAEQTEEVAAAINEMLEAARAEIHKEYSEKLDDAYATLSAELETAEKTTEEGYQQAFGIITELRNRLELQGEEYKQAMHEGYEEAFQMLEAEKKKNQQLEIDMYEEYDGKLATMKNYIVEKVDEFLNLKATELYEQARRDVLSDPRMAEHKVALDKIMDITSGLQSDDKHAYVNSAKLEEATKRIEELSGHLRIVEARNQRLSGDNVKLNEQCRQAKDLLTENQKTTKNNQKKEVINEQKERVANAKNVTGRGHTTVKDDVIVTENTDAEDSQYNDVLVLSGLKHS